MPQELQKRIRVARSRYLAVLLFLSLFCLLSAYPNQQRALLIYVSCCCCSGDCKRQVCVLSLSFLALINFHRAAVELRKAGSRHSMISRINNQIDALRIAVIAACNHRACYTLHVPLLPVALQYVFPSPAASYMTPNKQLIIIINTYALSRYLQPLGNPPRPPAPSNTLR